MTNKLKKIVLSTLTALPVILSGCDPIPVNTGDGESKRPQHYESTNHQISSVSTNISLPYSILSTNYTNFSLPSTNTSYFDSRKHERTLNALKHAEDLNRKQATRPYHP